MAVLNIVNHFAKTWSFLLQYDEDRLSLPALHDKAGITLTLDEARQAIASLKEELKIRGESTELFGNEHSENLAGIVGAAHQTFGGQDLYPSIEEKAANLLYFIVKDHPFTDGNKRIGSFLFLSPLHGGVD